MASTLRQRLDAVPVKNLAFKGEAVFKELETREQTEESRRRFGALIGRAFDLANLKKEAVTVALGYAHASIASHWISGASAAPLPRLLEEIDGFRDGLMLALAEDSPNVVVEKVLKLRRAL